MSVAVLLHCDSLLDSSPNGLDVASTLPEATVCSVDQSVFGGKSFHFPSPSHTHYVEVDTTPLIGIQNGDPYYIDSIALTVECRIFPTVFSSTRSTIVDFGWDGDTGGMSGWVVYLDLAGQLVAAAGDYIVPTGVYLTTEQWYAIKVSYGSSPNGYIDIAIDGTLVEFTPGDNYFEMWVETDHQYLLRVGNSRSANTAKCFQGYIDELRVSVEENTIDTVSPASYAVATEAFGDIPASALFPYISVFPYQQFLTLAQDRPTLLLTDVVTVARSFSIELSVSSFLVVSRRVYADVFGVFDLAIPANGKVSGLVTKNAVPVPFANVVLYAMDTGELIARALADSSGNYEFSGLNKYRKCMITVVDHDTSPTGYGAKSLPNIQPI